MSLERWLKKLTLEEKAGQLFMIGFSGKELSSEIRDFINRNNIGFVVLFSRNLESGEQLAEMVNQIHSLGKIPPMIFIDQEGGVVCQLGELAATFTSPMGLAATKKPEFAELAGMGIAEDLDLLGIDGVLAPVLDVNYEADNPIIGIRSFSDEVNTVIEFGKGFIRGIHSVKLASVAKHFPGHGGTRIDSHLELPVIDADEITLWERDMRPFREMVGEVDFIMTAHVLYPSLDGNLPATFSQTITGEILRKKLSFEGVLFSDCLEMAAIQKNFSPEQIVESYANSSLDVMTISQSFELQKELFHFLLEKIKKGQISIDRINVSLRRILRAKEKYGLFDRKKRNPEKVSIFLRRSFEKEKEVCRKSIVLLKNSEGGVPLDSQKKLGVIEWDKVPSTVPVSNARKKSFLKENLRKYFPAAELKVISLEERAIEEVRNFISSKETLLLATYSRNPEAEKIQALHVREILKIKPDAIVVAMGNPYDIRHFPHVKTYLASFGFRNCQLEALMEVLSGIVKPQGKLPVEIKGLFPRWSCWKGQE